MPARIAEVTIYDVYCPECGTAPEQFFTRTAAEDYAARHDEDEHTPEPEDA